MTDDALLERLDESARDIRYMTAAGAALAAARIRAQAEEIARLKEEAAHAQTCWEGLCDDERKAQAERDEALAFIADRGYRRCTNPACNCGKWHGGHLQTRHGEIDAVLGESGVEWAGTTLATVKALVAQRDEAREEIARLKGDCERERIRLAACGVVAMANTSESAERVRAEADTEYSYSASLDDVACAVDREMEERRRAEKAEAERDEWQGRCAWLASMRARSSGAEEPEDWLRKAAAHWRDLTSANSALRDEIPAFQKAANVMASALDRSAEENKALREEVLALKADAEKWREREARIADQNRCKAAELRRQADKLDAARAKGKE